jgi:hypothetical protein
MRHPILVVADQLDLQQSLSSTRGLKLKKRPFFGRSGDVLDGCRLSPGYLAGAFDREIQYLDGAGAYVPDSKLEHTHLPGFVSVAYVDFQSHRALAGCSFHVVHRKPSPTSVGGENAYWGLTRPGHFPAVPPGLPDNRLSRQKLA